MSKLPFRLLDRWDMVAKKRVNLCLLLDPVTHLPLPGISGPWDSFSSARSPRILKKLVKHLTGEQNINRVTSRWMKITWKCSPWWMKITWKWSPCIVLQRDVTVERHWENSVAANYWLALEMSAILKLVAVAGLISALGVKRKRETEYFLSSAWLWLAPIWRASIMISVTVVFSCQLLPVILTKWSLKSSV